MPIHNKKVCSADSRDFKPQLGPPYNLDMPTRVVVALFWVVFVLELPLCSSQSQSGRQQQIESHTRKAAGYLKENKPNLAVPEFRAILALDPNNVDAHGNLGAVLFFQEAYADALPQLRAAVKSRPTLWKTRALLGIAEKRTGDTEAARRDLEKAFPNLQEAKIRTDTGMELIEIYSGEGELDTAAATIATLRRLSPADPAILYSAYRLYSDLADDSLLTLSIVDPKSARMHQAMAHELAKRGNTPEAIENYRAALKIDSRLPGLHFELADMLNTLSTAEGRAEAKKEYEAALEVNPSDGQAECRLGDIALQRDDLKEASERYARAVQLQPRDPEASIGLAKVLMTMDQPQKAEPLLQHALQLDPTSALAHFRLSTIYRQSGRAAEAKHELEEYQKYKEMKDKLRKIYHDLHPEQPMGESDDANPK